MLREMLARKLNDRRSLAMVGLAALTGLIFLRSSVWPALWNATHGFPVYYTPARLILEGRWSARIYDDAWFGDEVAAQTNGRIREVYSPNPPGASLLLIPLAWLDMAGARVAWILLNLLFLAVSLWLIAAALSWSGEVVFRAGMIAFALSYAPLRENFRLGQAYVFLLFLFALAFWSLSRQRWVSTGIALGTAALAKLSGGVLWLMLASRGRWREIVAGALVGAGLLLTSVIITGWEGWKKFFSILPEHLAGNRWPAVLAFQTTPSFFQHLFVADAQWNPRPLWHQPWLAVVLSVGVSGVALAVTLWRSRRSDFDLAFAAAATLGVVLFPLAEEYHYTLLLLPLAVIASRIARKPFDARDVAGLVIAALLLSAPWPYTSQRLNDGWYALLAYPRLYGGWLVWVWLIRHMLPIHEYTSD